MTRDDIIRMAREAGFAGTASEFYMKALERFAALVVAAEREKFTVHAAALVHDARHDATEREREACAQILDRNANACVSNSVLRDVLQSNATAIRARGKE